MIGLTYDGDELSVIVGVGVGVERPNVIGIVVSSQKIA